jgi:protein SCO1/2
MSMMGDWPFLRGWPHNRAIIGPILAVATLAGSGCGGGTLRPSGADAPPASAGVGVESGADGSPPGSSGAVTTTDYALKGIVLSVAPESGRVTIRHEEIPGFMKAMTMPFQPADESILGLLHPGDEVEGILHVEKQDGAVRDYQLRDLRVTKPAAPRALTLDISREKVQLHQRPPRLQIGEAVPDYSMTGQDGRTFKLSDLRGKVVVLTFIYTRCPMPNFCPLMDRKFSELAQSLNAFPRRVKDIRLISLSFDPENDTPDVLRKHAEIRGAIPPLWSYAVASHDELARIAPRLGLWFGPDGKEIAHNLCTAIIDPQGKLARLEEGTQPNRWETADFLRTIYGLLPGSQK